MKVYVASSWRNIVQQAVIHVLHAAKIDCYDFRDAEGFHWSEVMPRYNGDAIDAKEYLAALDHPRSIQGFNRDFQAMQECDTCVLVLPCGRSANLELGWFIGQGKRTAVLLDNPCIPDLMYKLADYIAPSMFDLLGWLGVED